MTVEERVSIVLRGMEDRMKAMGVATSAHWDAGRDLIRDAINAAMAEAGNAAAAEERVKVMRICKALKEFGGLTYEEAAGVNAVAACIPQVKGCMPQSWQGKLIGESLWALREPTCKVKSHEV